MVWCISDQSMVWENIRIKVLIEKNLADMEDEKPFEY